MENGPAEAREYDLLKIAALDGDALYGKMGHYLNLA